MHAKNHLVVVLGISCAHLLASGCDRSKPAQSSELPAATASSKEDDRRAVMDFLRKEAPPPTQNAGLPAGHPPIPQISGGDMSGGLPPGHPPIDHAPAGIESELLFDAPENWASQSPSSMMRKAQFVMPRASGDSVDGQLIVYYFGAGQGGTTEMNLDRWIAMMSAADGSPVAKDAARIQSKKVGGLDVTTLDVSGFYHDPMMGAAPPISPDQDARMFAAVIETAGGPWFFKAVGPAGTMAAHQDAFEAFVQTVRLK